MGPKWLKRHVVKGCAPEMISRTLKDHNLGEQPCQLVARKLQGVSKRCDQASFSPKQEGVGNIWTLPVAFLQLVDKVVHLGCDP